MTTVSGAQGTQKRQQLERLDAFWRAANYLSVGQIYLLDNPLLREPLRDEHVKPRLLGHFGTVPGLNLIWAHMNRAIRARDLEAITITGPGHGGPGVVACAYLEGTYSERYPHVDARRGGPEAAVPAVLVPRRDPEPRGAGDAGLDPRGRRARLLARARVRRRLRQPGAGRLLRRRRRRGRDRAAGRELALATSSSTPRHDGAVLPVLHLNGYKIANPTVLARIPEQELVSLLEGYGHRADPRHRRVRRRGPTGRPRAVRGRPGRGARRHRERRARAAAAASGR